MVRNRITLYKAYLFTIRFHYTRVKFHLEYQDSKVALTFIAYNNGI